VQSSSNDERESARSAPRAVASANIDQTGPTLVVLIPAEGFHMIREWRFAYALFFLGGLLVVAASAQGKPATGKITNGRFALSYDARGTSVSNPQDPYGAEFLTQNGRLGEPVVKYKVENGDWQDISARERKLEADLEHGSLAYTDSDKDSPLRMVQRFRTDGTILDWTIEIETTTNASVQIGDLGVPIPWRFPSGENPEAIFEKSFTKHHFISGNGSFIYFTKPSGDPPYLMITVHPGTKLEYYASTGRGLTFIPAISVTRRRAARGGKSTHT
jgi:hypothetical protein